MLLIRKATAAGSNVDKAFGPHLPSGNQFYGADFPRSLLLFVLVWLFILAGRMKDEKNQMNCLSRVPINRNWFFRESHFPEVDVRKAES